MESGEYIMIAWNPSKVFKWCGTFDDCKQEAKIVYFSWCRFNEIHLPQSKAFLAKQPLPLILLISEELQKFLVGVFPSLFSKLSLVLIGFKPCSKGGAVISTLLKDSSKIVIRVKHYHVVIFEMNLEANNVWDLLKWRSHQIASGAEMYWPSI